MRRRTFVTLLGGATAAWPLAARAQQPAMPVIGTSSAPYLTASLREGAHFGRAFNEAGFIEGENVDD